MRYTKFIALVFLVVPSFCATFDSVKADFRYLEDTCKLYKNAANYFPPKIDHTTSPLVLKRVTTAAATVLVAVQAIIPNLKSLDAHIAKADGRILLANIHNAAPAYDQAIDYLLAKRDALKALAIGDTNALDAVRKDIEVIRPFSDLFEDAFAAALEDQSQVAEWKKLADGVIAKQDAAIAKCHSHSQ